MKHVFSYKKIHIKKFILFLWITVLIIVIDYMTKKWVIHTFDLYQNKTICSFLNLFYIHNNGMAFGLLSQQKFCPEFLIFFTGTMVTIKIVQIFYSFFIKETYKNYMFYCFIIGGAIGNLIDRIKYGCVIDFIDIHIYTIHLPIFNIADISIMFGALASILYSIFLK
ncbi:signal peptidase II [Buchnera aphidicola]|nr:signal peptidase II [Buchnera aphidicola]